MTVLIFVIVECEPISLEITFALRSAIGSAGLIATQRNSSQSSIPSAQQVWRLSFATPSSTAFSIDANRVARIWS